MSTGSFPGNLRRKGLGQILDNPVSFLLGDVRIFLQHFQYFILPLCLGGPSGNHAFERMAGCTDGFDQFLALSLGKDRRRRLPRYRSAESDHC